MARRSKAVRGGIRGKGKPSDNDPIREFHLFNKLPAEIRLQIWKLNLPGPRFIQLKRVCKPIRIVSTRDPITNLAVCQESRYEALKAYELAFPTTKAPAQTYINFSIDTVFIDSTSHFKLAGKCLALWKYFSRIHSLVILSAVAETFRCHDLRSLSSLEEILVVKRPSSLQTGLHKMKVTIWQYDLVFLMPSMWFKPKARVQDMWKMYHKDILEIEPPPLKVSCAHVFI